MRILTFFLNFRAKMCFHEFSNEKNSKNCNFFLFSWTDMKKPEKILKKKNWAWISSFLNFPAKMSFQKALNFQKYLIKNWGKIWKKSLVKILNLFWGSNPTFFFKYFLSLLFSKIFLKAKNLEKMTQISNHFILKKKHMFSAFPKKSPL